MDMLPAPATPTPMSVEEEQEEDPPCPVLTRYDCCTPMEDDEGDGGESDIFIVHIYIVGGSYFRDVLIKMCVYVHSPQDWQRGGVR